MNTVQPSSVKAKLPVWVKEEVYAKRRSNNPYKADIRNGRIHCGHNPFLYARVVSDLKIEITDDGIAILQFGGGCQGCGMVNLTLQEGVQKTLLEKFPNDLTGVKDVTEHADGDNPYYR